MRIDPRRFLEFVIFLIICLWLMVIYLAGVPNSDCGYCAYRVKRGGGIPQRELGSRADKITKTKGRL